MPTCTARTVHQPGATSVTDVPLTVQTSVVAVTRNETVNPLDAVAPIVNGDAETPNVLSASASKVMV